LTDYSVERLYALKGEIVSRGIKAHTGVDMAVFPKRRYQHGALDQSQLRAHVPSKEIELRRQFLSIYQ
jgi:asparagine synthase (glutamine-hydrolysing)